MSNKWDNFYLDLARQVSSGSKDPSTKVGVVIVDSYNRLVSTGFNGLPRGLQDTEERLQNREVKYKLTLHAELNAILFSKQDLRGCTLYLYPFMPCSSCACIIIQAGIRKVVAPQNDNPRWEESFKLTKQLFEEANVELMLSNRFVEESRDSKDSGSLAKSLSVVGNI